MKASCLSAALTLASLYAHTVAEVVLGPFPDVVDVGSRYTLSWTATQNYTYTLWLAVQAAEQGGYGWRNAQDLGTNMVFDHLQGIYTWTVPANLSSYSSYSLWLNGVAIPSEDSSYASNTEWFKVSLSSFNDSTSTSTSSSGSYSATQSATASTSPITSSTGEPTHHNSLTRGAIVGIVIGILLAIALIVVAVLFGKWRGKQTALQKREAAARDGRLASVMHGGAGSFEMDGRNPQANKDFNV